MKRLWICMMSVIFLLSGCGGGQTQSKEVRQEGRIGEETPIRRELAAKMVALAFYTLEELEELPKEAEFPDVPKEDWAYPYINGAVELGFFSGDGEGFRPKDDLCLWEAQVLMDRLAPDFDSRMVLTDENRNMPVSYSLWVQLLEKALLEGRGEKSLGAYGIGVESQVLFLAGEENIFDRSAIGSAGYDLAEYTDTRLAFWEKDGELTALLVLEDITPTIYNIYCEAKEGEGVLTGGAGKKGYPIKKGELSAGIYDVTITEGKAEFAAGEKVEGQVVKRVSEEEIYLSDKGALPWAEGFRVYNSTMEKGDAFDLICGTDLAEFYIKDSQVMGAVIRKDVLPERIRVLLGGGGLKKVEISGQNGFRLVNGKTQKEFTVGEKAELTPNLGWFDHGIITVEGEVLLKLGEEERRYSGLIELERKGEEIMVVNELPMETYLLGVVPYEMPVRFGQGALEAQALCARSYAFNQFYANAYGAQGAHVTDTVASQVFMGADTAPEAEEAVKATEGMGVVYQDKVAQTYFYSASCGFGAKDTEVWTADGTFSGKGKAYLQAVTHGVAAKKPQSEEEWQAFFQNWEEEGYDKESPWFRWKVYFGANQLTEILEKTLTEVSRGKKSAVQVQGDDASFQEETPKNLGELTGMAIVQRGEGGVIQVLELTFENTTVRVKTENAIRKVLSPTKISVGEDIYLQRISGGTLTGQKLLPSGYFSVKEMRNEEGRLTGVALYGGGCGHGVGMSQYGAKGLGAEGKSGAEIIAHYFPGATVEKIM